MPNQCEKNAMFTLTFSVILKKKLEHFIEKEILYQTETFRILFEANAIPNMHQEINGL